MRLRRCDPSGPGYRRRRRGRGFSYLAPDGRPVTDPGELARLRALVIPPAWRDVWICPDPRGHVQATGVDAAGRRQYLYHPVWRAKREAQKFDRVQQVAGRLPRLRRRVSAHLRGEGLSRERVLATAVRLLESGLFRVGGDEYATSEDATYGLATLRPEHVRVGRDGVVFEYLAKGGIERVCTVTDTEVREVLRELRRRRRGADRLFAYRVGRRWREVRSDDVNGYLREVSGCEMTAKDFRTWHATVLAVVLLAQAGVAEPVTRRRRTVARVMREVAEELGNTPAVTKASYVDPRVVDHYHEGVTVPLRRELDGYPAPPAVERAVLALLTEDG
ncbi:MAG TPA: DNA topoisomerase IB [Micromonosporaceae bacterium]|nr:DNA topoisomerase IB [Micromonosporaceae bacterium]